MRCMDVLLAFPALLLAIFIVTVLGRGLVNAIIAISLCQHPGLRPRRARQRAVGPRAGLRGRRPRPRRVEPPRILIHRVLPNA